MKDYTSLAQVREDISNGAITCQSLTASYIQKINASEINAFLEVFETSALEKAIEVDQNAAELFYNRGLVYSSVDEHQKVA